MSPTNLYIAIEGPIGVGKSTLARLIQPSLNAQLVMEVFEENPFLASFYANREQYAFQTQLFFLLSRYRQQTVAPELLRANNVVSDYTFCKDRLFAHLNLTGDELDLYEHLYTLLAERLRKPDLIVYLFADTDVLLERIAIRDRQYERDMDRDYMEALNVAYAEFFADYDQIPVLAVDTNHLNIVRNAEDLDAVRQRIRSALGRGTHQQPLPATGLREEERLAAGSPNGLPELQRWHQAFNQEAGLASDAYLGFLNLQAQVGELAHGLGRILARQRALQRDGMRPEPASQSALAEHRPDLRAELAGCLAQLLELANDVGIDLEDAYLQCVRANGPTLAPDHQRETGR